jgi:hypothetical protein
LAIQNGRISSVRKILHGNRSAQLITQLISPR